MEPVGRQAASTVRRGPGGMAASPLRGLAVAGGGESSESEDDGWEIGYLDRTAQVAKEALSWPHLNRPSLAMKPLPCLSFPNIFSQREYRLLDKLAVSLSFPYCVFHQIRLFRLSIWLSGFEHLITHSL